MSENRITFDIQVIETQLYVNDSMNEEVVTQSVFFANVVVDQLPEYAVAQIVEHNNANQEYLVIPQNTYMNITLDCFKRQSLNELAYVPYDQILHNISHIEVSLQNNYFDENNSILS